MLLREDNVTEPILLQALAAKLHAVDKAMEKLPSAAQLATLMAGADEVTRKRVVEAREQLETKINALRATGRDQAAQGLGRVARAIAGVSD